MGLDGGGGRAIVDVRCGWRRSGTVIRTSTEVVDASWRMGDGKLAGMVGSLSHRKQHEFYRRLDIKELVTNVPVYRSAGGITS
ncbi:hypothetical protein E2542_SST22064 [Spatholobus suberectus]|nr:hypothetical protein E2542_SST22064 [Spatholobus suberectus]